MVELQQTGIVAQLIGMCEEPAWPEVVLQYHSLGSLLTVSQLPDVLSLRWRIIMSYLDVVEKLHNRVPRSPRVLCDASRTEITLSQVIIFYFVRSKLNGPRNAYGGISYGLYHVVHVIWSLLYRYRSNNIGWFQTLFLWIHFLFRI